MERDLRAEKGAGCQQIQSPADVLALAGEEAKELDEVVWQSRPFNPQGFEAIRQFQDIGLARQAIGVADDGDFFAALDGVARARLRMALPRGSLMILPGDCAAR